MMHTGDFIPEPWWQTIEAVRGRICADACGFYDREHLFCCEGRINRCTQAAERLISDGTFIDRRGAILHVPPFDKKMNTPRLKLILLRGLIVIVTTSLCAMVAFYLVAEVWMPGNKPFDEYYVALVFGIPVGGLVGIALGMWLASKVRGKKLVSRDL